MAYSFHINDLNTLGDLQIDFKFLIEWNIGKVLSDSIGNMIKADGGEEITKHILSSEKLGGEGSNVMTAYARSVTYPMRENGQLEDHYQGWKTIFPGKMNFGNSLSIAFAERQNGAILRTIQAWQELINSTYAGSPNSSFQKTGDFKGGLNNGDDAICARYMKVTMMTTDGEPSNVSAFYYNVWPKVRQSVSLDMTSEGFVKPNIDFVFDWSNMMKKA